MNKVVLMGRLTRDPDVRYTQGPDSIAIARYTLAVDRRRKAREGEQNADFISCIAFGKSGEFAEKYLHKGSKICASGRIQTGSYTNRDGAKVYTTDVVVDDQEFAESKGQNEPQTAEKAVQNTPEEEHTTNSQNGNIDGFMDIPDNIDEEVPFT